MKAALKMAEDIRNCVADAAENLGLRSKAGGIIGSRVIRSHPARAAIRAAPASSAASVPGVAKPACVPCTRPQVSAPIPAETRIRAGTSSRAFWPRDSASHSRAPTAAARPIGTFTQKIQCQSRPWVTAPPMSGPLATASPAMPPQMPTTVPRRSGGNAEVSSVSPSGMMIAAPSPCTPRQAISTPALGASAHAAEASVNTSRPVTYTRRRPSRSPSAAAVMMPAPKARL
jgi:hypothetical protein